MYHARKYSTYFAIRIVIDGEDINKIQYALEIVFISLL